MTRIRVVPVRPRPPAAPAGCHQADGWIRVCARLPPQPTRGRLTAGLCRGYLPVKADTIKNRWMTSKLRVFGPGEAEARILGTCKQRGHLGHHAYPDSCHTPPPAPALVSLDIEPFPRQGRSAQAQTAMTSHPPFVPFRATGHWQRLISSRPLVFKLQSGM